MTITPRTLSGFQELLPGDQIMFESMLERIRRSFELYGFTPLDTPVIEASEVLLAKAGGETEKQIYRVRINETEHVMRFDLTVPLAKYAALHSGQLTFPFRRYQIGKVYRGERAQRGRFREFYQCDIDIVGDGELGILNEAEIPSVIYDTFNSLGLRDFIIRINNRKVLNGLFEILDITAESASIMRTIDKIDKIGADKTLQLLITECGLQADAAEKIIGFISAAGSETEHSGLPRQLSAYLGHSETFDTGVFELGEVVKGLRAFGVPESHFRIDLTIARGLDYYTGTVYETFITAHPEIGSICSGGRYDDLAGYYTDRKLPGVGISIGLSRLFYVLSEHGYLNRDYQLSSCDVLILPMTEDFTGAAALAALFRRAGIRTAVFSEKKKFKQKMTYADKMGVPYAAILGEDELREGRVTLRDMLTGEQTTASASLIVAGLKEKLADKHDITPIKEP